MTNSIRLATLALALACAVPATAQSPDLGPWDGVWFKVKLKQKGLAFRVNAPGIEKDRGGGVIYLQLHVDTSAPLPLSADVWVREDQWELTTVPLLYLAGATDDVAVYVNQVPVTPDPVTDLGFHLGFALRLQAKMSAGTVAKGALKSLGGWFVEVDDVPGSDQRFAGSLTLKGKTTTRLPTDLPGA